MIIFVKKYWERIVLILVTSVFFILVGSGVYLQRQNGQGTKHKNQKAAADGQIQPSRKKGSSQPRDIAAPQATAFYLKPLPGELLEQIAALDSLDEKVATGKFSGLPVMWEAYFFSLEKREDNTATVQLDVSEDGFGVILICDVDLDEYPDILEIEGGEKIWVAGEIAAVDPSGTGTIYLKTDYLRFTEDESAELAAKAVTQ